MDHHLGISSSNQGRTVIVSEHCRSEFAEVPPCVCQENQGSRVKVLKGYLSVLCLSVVSCRKCWFRALMARHCRCRCKRRVPRLVQVHGRVGFSLKSTGRRNGYRPPRTSPLALGSLSGCARCRASECRFRRDITNYLSSRRTEG